MLTVLRADYIGNKEGNAISRSCLFDQCIAPLGRMHYRQARTSIESIILAPQYPVFFRVLWSVADEDSSSRFDLH